MKNRLSVIIILSLLFACNKPSGELENGIEDNIIHLSEEEIKAAGIETSRIQEKTMYHEIECIGVVDVPPQNLASVHSKIEGFAREVKFLPGDFVKKGELLVVLEHPGFVPRQQQLLELKSKLAFLKAEFERKKELYEEEASSLKLLQQAESEYLSLNSTYQGLRAELQMIGFNVDKIESNMQPQTLLEIRSPISGYITHMNINLGKLVMSNDLLYEIVDRDHLHVELQVYAKDVPQLKLGDTLEVSFPGKEKAYLATIYLIGKQIDPASRTTNVHAHLVHEEEEKELVLGSTFHAIIFSGGKKVYTLPYQASVREENRYYFFKEVGGGFEKVLLRTGSVSKNDIEILQPDNSILNSMFVNKGTYYLQGIVLQQEE